MSASPDAALAKPGLTPSSLDESGAAKSITAPLTVAKGTVAAPAAATAPAGEMTPALTLLFAVAVGVIFVNVTASQTLTGVIGPSLGLSEAAAGLTSMAPLLGYAAGLFFAVPLADVIENRRLILRMLICAVLAALGTAVAPSAPTLLAALFVLGAACSAVQVLVPMAAAMTPPERRGRVIGDVMSGVMVGILLSRPLASFTTDLFGWRAFYGISGTLMAILTLTLASRLAERRPAHSARYPALIASFGHLLRSEPVLRRFALNATLAMFGFTLYWTSIALLLAAPPFSLGQSGIALFALVGAGAAVMAPLAGRAGDRGWTRPALVIFHILMVAGFALAAWAGAATSAPVLHLVLLGASAVLLDVGVVGDQTLGRRAVNLLQPEARGRVNALFVALFFIGGAIGSAAAGFVWDFGGWTMLCLIGGAIGLVLFLLDCLGPPAV
jgi:predicted MFS family arabinose efflux permease